MNDNWYKTEEWYRPNAVMCEAVPHAPVPAKEKKPKNKKRRIIIMICAASALLLGILAAIAINVFGGLNPMSLTEYPKDYRDYFSSIYDTTAGTKANVDIETVEAREDLSVVLRDPSGTAISEQSIYSKCAPSIVAVKASVSGKSAYNWGTGIVLASDGYIVTNTHVIDGCNLVKVELFNGEICSAKLVGADSISDIAVLKIEKSGLSAAEFADVSNVHVGDSVYAIGNPLGEQFRLTMTDGIISGISREMSYNGYTMKLLQTNTAINEGNSGGPLLNDRGQVIGITNMKMMSSYSSIEGIGFAIPSDTVKSMVDALLRDGAVYGRSMLGITVGPMSEEAARHYDIPRGLYVSSVSEGSDAELKGVQVGDIILSADGETVKENDELTEIKNKHEIGDSIALEIWRGGETLKLDIVLMDANDFGE